jgi:hypothetical protein
MYLYDLELLRYCRDPKCPREDVHEAHGRVARTITASKPVIEAYCTECGTVCAVDAAWCSYCYTRAITTRTVTPHYAGGVSRSLIDVTYTHVGTYVPTPFVELHRAVVDDFGATTERNVQRALRVLIDERHVASLANSLIPLAKQRNPRIKPPGWYVRYDSPKLWRPGGLRDLMSVAAEKATENIDLRPGARRRSAGAEAAL